MLRVQRETVVVLDFGSQYSQLIARRVRELEVYCEMLPYNAPQERIDSLKPVAYILSGGPSSVYADGAPHLPEFILSSGKPILGICYGMQLIAYHFGGRVMPGTRREYGQTDISLLQQENPLFSELSSETVSVWMSHGDKVSALPEGFEVLAKSANSTHAAIGHTERKLYGLQFHPEVTHTPQGQEILRAFLYTICGCAGGWTAGNFIEESLEEIRDQVGDGKVICGLSGGVDSSVAAALLYKAIGARLTCIFVDTGLLRKDEAVQVKETFEAEMHVRLVAVDAEKDFLDALEGVIDPERKRIIIGEKFVRIFEAESRKIGSVDFLAQGTLYPDVIESANRQENDPAAKIKTHHNVGGLPDDMELQLIEPLRFLFKDEVRKVGEALGLPKRLVWRHPFPGPGLAVRVLGKITKERLDTLREADAIMIEELWKSGWYHKSSQSFAVLLPVQSVGVMGDGRTYSNVIALRSVTSDDFMTADWTHLPVELLSTISSRIVNEVAGVNRVVYDITSKPPATIEWE
ncbi:glutamine-hydrolyzing GMP synthase [candidate division KSB3 bacterium]|uniref:GMP synthase [glutamine-hydrolyzing] n=1 Tax=candidate division KSB3 bacterium TaxID=2044937 RepID=A0A2G6E9L7_9BACT|nr:MAG: glutamine-hydrolyzing GMP synthase [candidate division KSB3 bacterium]PIE30857.1 MAG: glutamine-hydrolyzing GMP synthase [candidate division KSB3 bacterium]